MRSKISLYWLSCVFLFVSLPVSLALCVCPQVPVQSLGVVFLHCALAAPFWLWFGMCLLDIRKPVEWFHLRLFLIEALLDQNVHSRTIGADRLYVAVELRCGSNQLVAVLCIHVKPCRTNKFCCQPRMFVDTNVSMDIVLTCFHSSISPFKADLIKSSFVLSSQYPPTPWSSLSEGCKGWFLRFLRYPFLFAFKDPLYGAGRFGMCLLDIRQPVEWFHLRLFLIEALLDQNVRSRTTGADRFYVAVELRCGSAVPDKQ